MIRIDQEFKALIPPLTADEYAQLEENIVEDGCRDPLVLWGDVLIDGHNRWGICARHGIHFNTVQMDFAGRDEAKAWIIKNQFGRRNLLPYVRSVLALKLKPLMAEKAKERQGTRTDLDNIPPMLAGSETRDKLAEIAGVSHGTIAKVERIEAQASEEIKEQLRTGEISINQAYKAVKLDEKKEQIKAAERSIADQAKEGYKPVLDVGDMVLCTREPYDLLLTDPPYSTDVGNIDSFVERWLYDTLELMKPTGAGYVFIGAYPEEIRAYLNAEIPNHVELEQVLIWTYKNTLGQNPKDHYKQNYQACLYYRGKDAPDLDCPLTTEQWAVQEINAPDGRQGDRYHPWQKPMEIAERFIRHSSKPGDLVYDPYAGTGTFLLAASKLGRRAYGCEIDPETAKIAFERGCIDAARDRHA